MGYEVKWIIEDCLLLNRYFGRVKVDDLANDLKESFALLENINSPFFIIIDLSDFEELDTGLSRVSEIVNKTRDIFNHPQLAIAVAYGSDNRMLKFLGTIAAQVTKRELHFVPTYAEAIELLARRAPNRSSELLELVGK